MSSDFQVAIVGGGMVGAALACALGRADVRTALIEPNPPTPLKIDDPYELRVSALSPPSKRILGRVGAWERMTALRVSPYQQMRIWDADGSSELHFDADQLVGVRELGHIVENRVTCSALWEVMRGMESVSRFTSCSFRSCSIGGEICTLDLDGEETITTQLLVGADGGASAVRRAVGIDVKKHDYNQRALVAVVQVEKPHQQTAWQRFGPGGPLAFLPLADGSCSIVWTLPAEDAESMADCDTESFQNALGEAIEWRLGSLKLLGERALYPLQMQRATSYINQRAALVGDAAHQVHPLAGLGVNLGFLDAAVLAEVVEGALSKNSDPGLASVLRGYQRRRMADNVITAELMTALNRLFGSDVRGVKVLRSLGLGLVDRSPLKRLLAEHVVGYHDDHPQLAR